MPSRKCSLADGRRQTARDGWEDPGVTLHSRTAGRFVQSHPRILPVRAGLLVAAVLGLGVGLAACGGGDASGAAVNVYVGKSLCRGAQAELGAHGGTAGSFQVLIRCLAPDERDGGVDLATNGSNSRRATEDTSAVATLEAPGPGNKFARAILESAGIPLVTSPSGKTGMTRIVDAIEGAGTGNVRESVQEALEPS